MTLPTNVSSIGGGKHCKGNKSETCAPKEGGMVYWLKCIWECLSQPSVSVFESRKVTPDCRPIVYIARIGKDGTVCFDTFAINPETSQPELYEGPCEKEQLSVNVDLAPGEQDVCVVTRPFDCEFFASDGPVKITNASLLDSISGALIGGTYAINPATVCLNKIDFILMARHDESEGGGTSWTSDATITDIETGKTKDVETGGGSCLSVPAGYDLHQFCIDVCHGSVVEICGEVSVRVDKATCEAIPKPAAKINLLDA
jgi:hypothetical protein